MKIIYIVPLLLLIAFICTYLLLRHRENFNSAPLTNFADTTGVPDGYSRTRQVFIDMGDHNTIATITHGTTDDYVILVHGYPLSQQIWEPVREEISLHARLGNQVPTLITYDLRGCGSAVVVPISESYLDANPKNKEWTLKLFSNDLYRVYKALVGSRTNTGIRKISVGGWGFGGCVVQEFALEYPKYISNLYLFSSLGVTVSEASTDIRRLSNDVLQHSHQSLQTLPNDYVNKTMCSWFNVEDTTVCPSTTDLHVNDIDTLQYVVAKSLLTSGSLFAEIQILKIIATLDLLSRWYATEEFDYNVIIVSPVKDKAPSPNDTLKLYTAIKKNYRGKLQPSLMTPNGKHYYCLQNAQLVTSIICRHCKLNTIESPTNNI